MSSNKKIWLMEEFYDNVASGYDEHMREIMSNHDRFYDAISSPVEATKDEINILDLGCGTGNELKDIFSKCPNAKITGVDISREMLMLLKKKYKNYEGQITLVHASYETVDLPESYFDYALCSICLHHYPYERKLRYFKRVYSSIKKGGMYIEGDFMATPLEEIEYLKEYNVLAAEHSEIEDGAYHVDAPACVATEIRILTEAGFKRVDVEFKEGNTAVMVGQVE